MVEQCIFAIDEYTYSQLGMRKLIMVSKCRVLAPSCDTVGEPTTVGGAPPVSNPQPVKPPVAAPVAPKPTFNASAYSAPVAPVQQQRGAIVRNDRDESNIIPISALNPYNSRWTIKARITAKTPIRTWNNAKGSGKVMSIDLLDDQDGEIRCTMFGDAVDKFEPVFQQNGIYYISKGSVKMGNRAFAGHLNNDYEIMLNADAEVEVAQDSGNIKRVKYDFVQIENIVQRPKDAYVDVVGVVQKISPLSHIVSKRTNKQINKRNLTLVDKSMSSIELTLWNETAEKFTENTLGNKQVVAIKNCRVGDYGGRSLGTIGASHIDVNPDIPEAHVLKSWWDSQGHSLSFNNLSNEMRSGPGQTSSRKVFAAIKDENLGFGEGADYLTVKTTITAISYNADKPPYYNACPAPDCNKKVNQGNSGNWDCEKCSKSYPDCEPRYILRFQGSDFTDSTWLTCFNEIAEIIIGRKAKDIAEFHENGDSSSIDALFKASNFKQYNMRVKVTSEVRDVFFYYLCTVTLIPI